MMFQAGIMWVFFGFPCSERGKSKQSPSTVAVALHGFNPQPLLASLRLQIWSLGDGSREQAREVCVCVCLLARVLNKQTMQQQLQQIVSGANLL